VAVLTFELSLSCVATQGLQYSAADPIKISAKPQPAVMATLKCLSEVKAALGEIEVAENDMSRDSVSDVLRKHGGTTDVASLFQSLTESYQDSVKTLVGKARLIAEKQMQEMNKLTLPVYQPDDHDASVKDFMKMGSTVDVIAATVSKLTGFVAAVNTCFKIANVEMDVKDLMKTVSDGKTFMYTFTILTVLTSPTWKSMTPELAQKSDTKYGELVSNLQFVMKQVSDDAVALSGELQSEVSKKLAVAGVKLTA